MRRRRVTRCTESLDLGFLVFSPGSMPTPKKHATWMIAPDHEEQIERLLLVYFGNFDAGLAWLQKHFDAKRPHDLLTARQAGQVIQVLKDMIARRSDGDGNGAEACAKRGLRSRVENRLRALSEPRAGHRFGRNWAPPWVLAPCARAVAQNEPLAADSNGPPG